MGRNPFRPNFFKDIFIPEEEYGLENPPQETDYPQEVS